MTDAVYGVGVKALVGLLMLTVTSKLIRAFGLGNQRRQVHSPINYVTKLSPHLGSGKSIPAYRVLDQEGHVIDPKELTPDELVKLYQAMVTISVMDQIMYDAQRQGRISFYMTAYGEEATHIGSAAALDPQDQIFGQYREAGTLLWRGFTLDNFMSQCYSNRFDLGKGRQMPIHYGSAQHSFQTISSPLGTQIPQAVGAAYALKLNKKGLLTICYFGEGAASEGDAHAGMNMAATTASPVIFFCRNNGYAISTPTKEQYLGDGIGTTMRALYYLLMCAASRGPGYGMTTFRVDGNDLLAVYNTVKRAREICTAEGKEQPVLIEALTYRVGHHSTSDDSLAYRSKDEIDKWVLENNPITRFKNFLTKASIWNDALDKDFRSAKRSEILTAFAKAEKEKKPPVGDMFTDVYAEMPWNLKEQQKELQSLIEQFPEEYPLNDYAKE